MIPAEIANMPVLVMESVTAASGSVYYGTNFTKYKAIEAENVIQDIGTDNGYMRTRDGMCGTWEKSSAQAFHTPKATNGSLSQMEIEGALTLDAHVSRGLTSEDSSFVSYRVVSGPADLFPAEVYAYVDNGSVNDEWDANDIFLKADTLTAANDSTFLTRFLPQDQEVIFVIKTLQGCYDQVRLVLNPEIPKTALPVQLKMFTGKENQGKSLLEWVVSGNESGVQFEVEKSVNGKDFSTAGLVRNTSRPGEEYYSFTELLNSNAFYRLRILSKDNRVTYSPVIFVKDGAATTTQKLFIVQNPAVTSLVANYPAARAGTASIHIYNTLGVKVLSVEKALHKGPNTISISLDAKCTSGTYILELIHDTQRSVARFIKR